MKKTLLTLIIAGAGILASAQIRPEPKKDGGIFAGMDPATRIQLMKQFDKDGDGRLNEQERAAARYDDEAIAADNYFLSARDGDEKAPPADAQTDGAAAHGDARDAFARPRGTLTYYYSVKDRLDELFRGERDLRLLAIFPRSEWVKQGDALLGIIYEEGIPRYLCVAVFGKRPEEMGERAVFVPLSPFTEDSGAWIVFQDADTGEYIQTSIE